MYVIPCYGCMCHVIVIVSFGAIYYMALLLLLLEWLRSLSASVLYISLYTYMCIFACVYVCMCMCLHV